MAQADRTKMKSPNAMFELVVSADNGGRDKIQMEFSHEELYQFYGQVTVFSDKYWYFDRSKRD